MMEALQIRRIRQAAPIINPGLAPEQKYRPSPQLSIVTL
jgi:hypothetical protein